MARTAEDFVFFWKPEQPHGWASQWHKSPFSARVTFPDGEERDVTFTTAEHWMMGQKALLFGDQEIFERIVGLPASDKSVSPPNPTQSASAVSTEGRPVRNTRSRPSRVTTSTTKASTTKARTTKVPRTRIPGPKEVKALGRKVRNFDEGRWARERERIVLEGTLHKFRQHADLRALLLGTGERELVEASAMDRVWGVGVGARRAAEMCVGAEEWEGWGMNLLGRALGEARRILRLEGESEGASGEMAEGREEAS